MANDVAKKTQQIYIIYIQNENPVVNKTATYS